MPKFEIEETFYALLKDLAQKQHVSISDLINESLKDLIVKHGIEYPKSDHLIKYTSGECETKSEYKID